VVMTRLCLQVAPTDAVTSALMWSYVSGDVLFLQHMHFTLANLFMLIILKIICWCHFSLSALNECSE